jgi:acyl transferase domain-containing protein
MAEQVKGPAVTLERQALGALRKMRQKLDEIELARTEPVAIVGLGCRLPGGANDPESFWDLLRNGVDAIREVPADRWSVSQYFDPNPGTPGKTYSRWGGFMDHIDRFDPEFFGISPREAVHMDPQQRIFLEVAWEALEDAGIPPHTLKGSRTGVFVGTTTTDYFQQHLRRGRSNDLDAYMLSGNTANGISGRLAYFLGTHGPSISMDTACSSSLVAVDRACRSLREDECTLAIAGGVNLILAPELFICMSRWGMLSPVGRCKTFDAAADGFVRAEGCGIVVLRRLGAALAAGDRILALIRGSAVNQDGPSSGLSVPNGLAQEAVIRQALHNSQVEASTLSYIEAHGTGTSLGDPIEIDALARVFQPARDTMTPVAIGSVKTNLGHLEAASGIAGLLKVVLMLRHGQIPPHLHFNKPSPHIAWERYPFVIPTNLTDWTPVSGKRIAGISSFGFSGSNAHVIIEEGPETKTAAAKVERPLQLLTISARSEDALRDSVTSVAALMQTELELHFPDVCFTANTGRSQFGTRLSLLSSSTDEALGGLTAFLAGKVPVGLVKSRLSGSERPKIALLFSGQGAQYAGMGSHLYDTSPTFRKALNRCDELLRPHLDRSLLSLLFSQDNEKILLNQTIYTQPALFALEYSLYELWSSWGIRPSFVLGHSAGEYVAACVAGILSIEDGLKLISRRARLMQAEPAGGRMVAVEASEETVRRAIEPFARTLSVAAINGPRNVVISGAGSDMEAVVSRLAAEGVQTKDLKVSHAFHSPLMEPMTAAFEKVVAEIPLHPPALRLVSNLTGRIAEPKEITRPEYWRNQIREPVQFAAGIQTLLESGCDIFLELGPSPVLLAMGQQCATKANARWLPTLRPGHDDWSQLLTSLQALHHAGVPVDWKGFDADYPRRRLRLPAYPFQRERFWFEASEDTGGDRRAHRFPDQPDAHPLLGAPLRSPALKDPVFQSRLSARQPAFLADHQMSGHIILPAAAYVEMAFAGARSIFGNGGHAIEDLSLEKALQLDFETETCVQTIFQVKDGGGSAAFEILSTPCERQVAGIVWSRHVGGRVMPATEFKPARETIVSLQAIKDHCPELVDTTTLYQSLNAQGAEFGPGFRNVRALRRGTAETLAEIFLADSPRGESAAYRFHPALLDACFQAAAQAVTGEASATAKDEILLPVNIERAQILRDIPSILWSHGRVRGTPQPGEITFTLDLNVYDPAGQLLAEIAGLQLKRVKRRALDRTTQAGELEWLFEIQWRETLSVEEAMPARITSENQGTWLILTDARGVGESVRTRLMTAGQRCILARPSASFVRHGDDEFGLDPAHRADFERLLDQAGIEAGLPLRGVLHLWSLDFPDFDAMTGEDFSETQLLACGSTLHLVQALVAREIDSPPSVWLLTRGGLAVTGSSAQIHPAMTALGGMSQVISAEHPELHCRLLDLDHLRTTDDGEILFRELAGEEFSEDTIAFRDKSRLVPRLVRLPSATRVPASQQISAPVQLEVSEAGMLENLRWVPLERVAPGPDEVEIQVQASGLNFRDVLSALKMYPGKTGALGAECSGVVTRVGKDVVKLRPGDQVMAIAPGGFSTFVTVRSDHVSFLPAGLSLVEAASIPVAFLTTLYGLHRLARIKAGDRVLIHAAAGGVGLAAVQLAQRAGAEIFATAGSAEKRSHLQALGVNHLFDSRSLDFANEIMNRTDGRGVDIVLNSLAGEFIAKSVSVLAPGCRFLELGKRGILTKEQFAAVRPDCEYFAFDLGEVALSDSSLLPSMFNDLLRAFAKGELRPLPLSTFSNERTADAFRFMAQAKHIGKVVVVKPALAPAEISPNQLYLGGDTTYLITGGLTGLGLETARWMSNNGARNIVLMGRHPADEHAKTVIDAMQRQGARVAIEQCDLSDEAALADSLDRIKKTMPPLRGIVHAAGVLDDGILEQQTWSRFIAVMAPKARGSWNLHRLTLSLDLDFFVLFSAAAGLIGSPGQSSYAAANAFMDGLAHFRKANGWPALSINWGAWSQTGMAARLAKKDRERWLNRGLRPIDPDEGMAKLGEMIVSARAQVVAAPIDWSRMFSGTVTGRVPSLFSHLVNEPGKESALDGETRSVEDHFVRRLAAEPAGRRLAILQAHVESAASQALGATGGKALDSRRPLQELGLDSLMSVELRNALATALGRSLPATLLFDYPTVESLTHYLAKNVLNLEVVDEAAPSDSGDSDEKNLKELREMSESEAEALLLAELDQLKR